MIRKAHNSRRVRALKFIALTCAFAILLVGTLQATHIHKEWSASSPSHRTLLADTGKDAQCVFCLTSHAAAGLPQHWVTEQVQSSAADLHPDKAAHFPVVNVRTDTIRPPPMA